MERWELRSIRLMLAGMFLLLPGGCAIHFIETIGWPTTAGSQLTVEFWYILWAICFVISGLGLYLVVRAFRMVFQRILN